VTTSADEPGLRERKKRAARAGLQRAALGLVAEHGIAHVTVDDIAARADVSPRTFFNYFSSKEEALFAPDPDRLRQAEHELATRLPGAPVFEVLRSVMLDFAESAEEDSHGLELRQLVVEREPTLVGALVGATAASERTFVEAVHRRLGDDAPDGYAELVVTVTWAAFRSAIQVWRRDDKRHSLRDGLARNLELIACGLRGPG